MAVPDQNTLDRVARAIARPGVGGSSDAGSTILSQAAAYGANSGAGTMTAPSEFEATVEAAFLVANADGLFDDGERLAFQYVVLKACSDVIPDELIQNLLSELSQRLAAEGLENRARAVASSVTRRDQQLELLRTAALMAETSGGVSMPERNVLESLARDFLLDSSAVDQAIADATADLTFELD